MILVALLLIPAPQDPFGVRVQPLLEAVCLDCHAGSRPEAGLDLSLATTAAGVRADEATWLRVLTAVEEGRMPPPAIGGLEPGERASLAQGLLATLLDGRSGPTFAGRPTLRRLTPLVLEHALQDLLGVQLAVRRSLPPDAPSHGFDELGDGQFLTELFFESWADQVEEALDRVRAEPGLLPGGVPVPDAAHAWLESFLTRAFRRPPAATELESRLRLPREAHEPFEGLLTAARATLLSPHFLFRVEAEPEAGAAQRALSDYELAARLAFSLQLTLPDGELLARAAAGELRDPGALGREALRLLQQPESARFFDAFGLAWLRLRDLESQGVDVRRFSGADGGVRRTMLEETRRFLQVLFTEAGRVRDLVDADFSILNPALARHYRLPALDGGWQRVTFEDRSRGGLLTQASVLTATSFPLRTSPTRRGAWILESLLGSPPPPPPADAGSLPKDDMLDDGLSLRTRLARHASEPACASCHARIDPLGLVLEGYDGVGRLRAEGAGGVLDLATTLEDGTQLTGIEDLKQHLVRHETRLARALLGALWTYLQGRPPELRDRPAIDSILADTAMGGYRLQDLLLGVVRSHAFRHRDSVTRETR